MASTPIFTKTEIEKLRSAFENACPRMPSNWIMHRIHDIILAIKYGNGWESDPDNHPSYGSFEPSMDGEMFVTEEELEGDTWIEKNHRRQPFFEKLRDIISPDYEDWQKRRLSQADKDQHPQSDLLCRQYFWKSPSRGKMFRIFPTQPDDENSKAYWYIQTDLLSHYENVRDTKTMMNSSFWYPSVGTNDG